MKRNINLQDLSRDHHHGLLLGWKIRQGFAKNVDPETMVRYVTYFAKNALWPHFEEEEATILTYLDTANSYYIRTKNDHREIRTLVSDLEQSNGEPALQLIKLADLMDTHIRFEERELFPYLEQELNEQQLEEIGEMIASAHHPYQEDYPDEFWRSR